MDKDLLIKTRVRGEYIDIELGESKRVGLSHLREEVILETKIHVGHKGPWVRENPKWTGVVIRGEGYYDPEEIIDTVGRLWYGVLEGKSLYAMRLGLPIEKDLVRGWVRRWRRVKDEGYVEPKEGQRLPDIEIGPKGLHTPEQFALWKVYIEPRLDQALREIGLEPLEKERCYNHREISLGGVYDLWEVTEYLKAWLTRQGAHITS